MPVNLGTHPQIASPIDEIGPETDFAPYFRLSARPAPEWAIGPEVEYFGFTRDELDRIDFKQVQDVIAGFAPDIIGREEESEAVIEATLRDDHQHGRITLEPGGQVEYSGACMATLSDAERALKKFVSRLREVGAQQGIIFVAAGFDPLRGIDEQRWILKRRYSIMRPYLKSRGSRAWDMMCRTASIQVNLDYSDPEDLAKKFALANRLAPIAAAMFANSPFERGRLSGYKSLRYRTWLDTDSDRTGPSPLSLGDDFSIERFIDYVKRVPMFFIRRDGDYINLAGESFAKFIANGSGPRPIFQDFTDHLSTIFTEARLKPHIEQRSMDCGSMEMVMAALAFWKGIMYTAAARDAALDAAPRLTREEFAELQLDVARHGLNAQAAQVKVIDTARAAVELAQAGLRSIAPDEAQYLDILEQRVLREQLCPADILIRNFTGSWNGDIRKAVDYLQL